MFLSATQPRPPRPPRHNFVVSAITFEGFKLRSSNLTLALLIQISLTSSIIDIVVPSKMAAEKKFCINLKWPELLSKVNFRHSKWPIDRKWQKCHRKWFSNIQNVRSQKKSPTFFLYWSKMAWNAIESEFRTSKMVDGSHFVKNFQKN